MSKKYAKATGDVDGISLTKDKYLEICDIPTSDWYAFAIDITMTFNPGWDHKIPLKIIITPTSETSGAGIKWKCYCGNSEYIKFYKANNKLYLQTQYNYNATVYTSLKGSNSITLINSVVESINEGKEITETT